MRMFLAGVQTVRGAATAVSAEMSAETPRLSIGSRPSEHRSSGKAAGCPSPRPDFIRWRPTCARWLRSPSRPTLVGGRPSRSCSRPKRPLVCCASGASGSMPTLQSSAAGACSAIEGRGDSAARCCSGPRARRQQGHRRAAVAAPLERRGPRADREGCCRPGAAWSAEADAVAWRDRPRPRPWTPAADPRRVGLSAVRPTHSRRGWALGAERPAHCCRR